MELKRIDHAGINVRDLNVSAEWYKRVLGFDIVHKWQTTWMVGKGTMRLGLFLRPKATPVDDSDKRIVIWHIAFLLDSHDFEEAQEELKDKGIQFDPPDDSGIAKSIFFNDPDGYLIELITYYENRPPGQH